jgi:hypothetical protein
MNKGIIFGVAAGAFAVLSMAAQAGPVTTPPPVITANGDVKAIYIFANAADTSILSLATPLPAVDPVFCNHNGGGCTASVPGDVVDLGTRHGVLDFSLHDLTTHNVFSSVTPDSFGIYHVDVRTSYTYAGVPALSSSLKAELAALPNVTFMAWEDHTMSDKFHDFDYNDLIFAFSNTAPSRNPGVPEPLTLSLVGAGLLGAAGLRFGRKKS